jgi:hypothetical protein
MATEGHCNAEGVVALRVSVRIRQVLLHLDTKVNCKGARCQDVAQDPTHVWTPLPLLKLSLQLPNAALIAWDLASLFHLRQCGPPFFSLVLRSQCTTTGRPHLCRDESGSSCVTQAFETSSSGGHGRGRLVHAVAGPGGAVLPFDHVFNADATQHAVFTACAAPLVDAVSGPLCRHLNAIGCDHR